MPSKAKFSTKTIRDVNKALDFAADELVVAVLGNEGEEQCRDNQRLFDMVCDITGGDNLTKRVLDKLKRRLGVK
jgi:phage major head subunit gpT-like protein